MEQRSGEKIINEETSRSDTTHKEANVQSIKKKCGMARTMVLNPEGEQEMVSKPSISNHAS